MKLYSFDESGDSLETLPLAARRALDQAGLHLSLAGWTSLPLAARRELSRLGSERRVDVSQVARQASAARPAPSSQPRLDDPSASEPPTEVVRAFEPQGPIPARFWTALSPLDRYALAKVAAKGRPERLRGAYAEIVGHTRVSTHVQAAGGVRMVDVGDKAETRRRARAESRVAMSREAFELLASHSVPKGDVLGTARLAGIMAAKRTSEWIPLCHALALSHVSVDLSLDAEHDVVHVSACVETTGKTGVEMEALVAASAAALTVYDMLKGTDRGMQIGPTLLVEKSGGASGRYLRETPDPDS